MKQKKIVLTVMMLLLLFSGIRAGDDGFTQKDRELLIELRIRMMEIDKRFEQVDKRIDQVDKRIDQVDKRIDEGNSFNWMLACIFTTFTVAIMGLLFWDRRTMIRPFEKTVAEIRREIAENREINGKVVEALKEYAKKDRKFAEVVGQFNIF